MSIFKKAIIPLLLSIFFGLLIEFFQEVNGVQYMLNNGAYNVMLRTSTDRNPKNEVGLDRF